jgi:ferredoxin
VKDIRKMIGKMIWDAREQAEFELNCNTMCQCPFCVAIVVEESDSSEQSSEEEEGEKFDDCVE